MSSSFFSSVHRVLGLAALLSFAWPSIARAEDRRTNASQLVVMTINGEFLWDGKAPEEGSADFPWKGSPTEAREHMQGVAELIITGNADIVNLVEVENLDALTMLNDEFLQGMGYKPYFKTGADTATGQDVAVLSRIDPEGGAIRYDNRKGTSGTVNKSVTKNYIARFDIGGHRVAMIGLHFLARPNDPTRRLEREAQADAIRQMAVEEAAAGYDVIVLGDFNDYDPDDCCVDHIDSAPISNVLKMVKGMDPAAPADDLVNAASFVPKAARYTAFWDQDEDGIVDQPHELTSIDHVLLAPGLGTRVQTVEFMHGHNPGDVTDHFPIRVTMTWGGTSGGSTGGSTGGTTGGTGGTGTGGVPAIDGVRITELLPNPPGNEDIEERITLRNTGTAAVTLTNWKLRDNANTTWSLDGITLGPGEEKQVKRDNQPMAMNNNGDTIRLINPNGDVVQSITYSDASENEVISGN